MWPGEERGQAAAGRGSGRGLQSLMQVRGGEEEEGGRRSTEAGGSGRLRWRDCKGGLTVPKLYLPLP